MEGGYERDDEDLLKMKKNLSFKLRKISRRRINFKFNKKAPFRTKNKLLYIFISCLIIAFIIVLLLRLFKKPKKSNLFRKTISLNSINSINREELVFDNKSLSYQKAQNFIKNCIDGISVNQSNNILTDNQKVSAVIPVYNSKNIILRSIRSIQNQNMKDIEIVLVDDFSTDDTINYIEELQKEDHRIKIIKNQKNMGTLYSRSVGALLAKGKYIFPLDNGDMFLDYDVFDSIYNVANKDNFDIVEFKAINIDSLYDLPNRRLLDIMFSNHELNLVLSQPELGYFPLQPKNETGKFSIIDNYLWNKCIKTEIYQKGLNAFGEERYKRHMVYHEDLNIVILLFNVAESYKFIGKYGVLNVPNGGSKEQGPTIMNLYEMYLIDTLIIFSKNVEKNKKIIVQYMITLLNRNQINETLKSEDNKKLFNSLLDRIYSCELISQEDKNEIKELASKLNLS